MTIVCCSSFVFGANGRCSIPDVFFLLCSSHFPIIIIVIIFTVGFIYMFFLHGVPFIRFIKLLVFNFDFVLSLEARYEYRLSSIYISLSFSFSFFFS